MAHLANYTNDDMKFVCNFIRLPTTGNKDALQARLTGNFTKEHARIFEDWAGFVPKAGDATKAELQTACTQNGLKKTGNVADLALLLAMNRIERHMSAPAPPPAAAAPNSTGRVGTLDTLGLAVYQRADGTFFYNDDGRVDVHGNQKWTTTDGVAMKGQHPLSAKPTVAPSVDDLLIGDLSIGDFDANEFDDVMDRAGKDTAVGRLNGKRGVVYMDQRFKQLYIKRQGRKLLLPMGVKWTAFDDVQHAAAKPSAAKPSAAKSSAAKPEPSVDKENTAVGQTGGKKMALIVGISKYKGCPLKNPVNDAKAIGAKLKSMGFVVTVLLDCTEAALSKAVRSFTDGLSKDVACAVYFFAGHGCEYQNQNYVRSAGSNHGHSLPREPLATA